MKKKKLALVLLALVMAVGGGAAMTACDNEKPDENNPGTTQSNEYTVKFKSDTGAELSSAKVKHGNAATAPTVTEKAGYTWAWVDENGAAANLDSITADVTFTLKYTAKTDTAYTVEHYLEGVDGKYTLDSTESLKGTTDTTVNATVKTLEHYTQAEGAGEVLSGTIKGDGTLTLKVYYARERKTVTFTANGQLIDTQEIRYGATVSETTKPVPAKDKTESEEYSLSHWSLTEDGPAYDFSKPVEGDIALIAVYKKTARHYELEGDLSVSGMYWLSYDADGNGWDEKEDFDQSSVVYNTEFAFKIDFEGDEVIGTPVVKVTKYNDDGTEKSSAELTADEGGFYTFTIDADSKLEITGLAQKTYTVNVEVEMPEFPLEWAAKVKQSDIMARLTDKSGKDSYHENVIGEGKATLSGIKAGVYTLTFVKELENGGYEELSEDLDFEVKASLADENLVYTFTSDKAVSVGVHEVNIDDAYEVQNGVITNVVNDQTSNHHLVATFADFAPGTEDFALTATWQRDTSKTTEESDPTYGFCFTVGNSDISPFYNKNGMRFRGFSGINDVGGLIADAGYALGKSETAYDKVTLVTVRKAGKLYMYYTGEKVGNDNIKKTENKLIAVMDENGLYLCNGDTYTDCANQCKALVTGNITKVQMHNQQTKNDWVNVYGFGYTYDADVISSYADVVSAKLTLTGDIAKEIELAVAKTNKVELEIAEGKVVDTLTVNGKTVDFKVTDNGIEFYLDVAFEGGAYTAEIKLTDGAYTAEIKGTVTINGVAVVGAKVSDGKVYTYTDANGAYTLKTAAAASYTIKASADNYVPKTITVTDLTAAADIQLSEYLMGGSTTVGELTYVHGADTALYYHNDEKNEHWVNGAMSKPYTVGLDENDNEIVTAKAGDSARSVVLYNNFASDKFVAMAALKYDTINDKWPRIGFTVADAAGNIGMIGLYGNKYSSTLISGWGSGTAKDAPGYDWNGNADKIVGAGKIYIAMEYDNGNVKFYVKNQQFPDPDKWYLYYEGKMPSHGDLSGKVAVAIVETSNVCPNMTFSDFYIAELDNEKQDNVTVTAGEGATATIENGVLTVSTVKGKAISAVTYDGKNVMSDGSLVNGKFTYNLPAMWQVGNHTVNVTTEDVSVTATYHGKFIFEKTASVTFTNEKGVQFATETAADGSWSIELEPGKYTLTVSAVGAFTQEVELELTADTTDLDEGNLRYGFNGEELTGFGIGEKTTSAAVEFDYDKSVNPYDDLEIKVSKFNQTIAWAQPIATNAVWSFTIDFDENISHATNGTYYDQDMYWRWYVGTSDNTVNVGMNSNGGKFDDISGGDNNPFDGWSDSEAAYGMMGGLKMQWSVGDVRAVDFMLVREGKKISKYAKYHDDAEWIYAGCNEQKLSEDGVVYFKMYNSSRSNEDAANISYTIKNWKYDESTSISVDVANASKNATVTTSKTTAKNGEEVALTATAGEGYLVTSITIGASKYQVAAAKTASVDAKVFGTLSSDVVVTTVKESDLLALTGTVTVTEQYASLLNANEGSVTLTGENGKFVGFIQNGNYTVSAPAGKYTAKYSNGKLCFEKEIELTAAATENVVLNQFDQDMFVKVAGDGLQYKDGVLSSPYSGSTQESAFNMTFVPNEQIVEFGYTLKGNLSNSKYPFYGIFVKSNDGNVGRMVYTGGNSGDQIFFIAKNDYDSRLSASDSARELWKGGFIPGQDTRGQEQLGAVGIYWNQAYTNITFKFKIDGYNLSMWIKGSNKYRAYNQDQLWSSDEWVCCFENLNIYDRYNIDVGAQVGSGKDYLNTLYKLDQPCYFGPSARRDNEIINFDAVKFSDLWFNITDRETNE